MRIGPSFSLLLCSLAVATLSGCSTTTDSQILPRIKHSTHIGKPLEDNNPISPVVFCADPTGIEYEGRLYIWGTNDHQQYFSAERNTYEKIKSLVCFSTDDMVNWQYHGIINTELITPWIMNSWAPSVVSRVEEDGKNSFYLYFSNSGTGVGAISSSHPLGPWSDPKGSPVIHYSMPEIGDCPNPFDPGACIDDKGDAYLTFGGGTAKNGTDALPGVVRIAKLESDMVNAAEISTINAPYFFEASELNYLNGEYIYTLNTNWKPRTEESWQWEGVELPSICSMAYMKSTTPMDPESWRYYGDYFPNPGLVGMPYSNNHTHFLQYKNTWYILYHAMYLEENLGVSGGFRNMMVDTLRFNAETNSIALTKGTRRGVGSIKPFNPIQRVAGTTMSHAADIWFTGDDSPTTVTAISTSIGAWIGLRDVDFQTTSPRWISMDVEGDGYIEVRTGAPDGKAIAFVEVNSESNKKIKLLSRPSSIENLFFLFSNEGITLKSWEFGRR